MRADGSSSNRLTFIAVTTSVLGANAVAYPFWATCLSAAQVYIGVSEEALRWMIYSSALVSIPSILLALPAIRCFGLVSCTKCAAALSLLGCALRAVAVANGDGARRSTSAYIWVQLGSIIACTALAPLGVCGSLIASAGSSKNARLCRHIAVTMANPLGLTLGALLPELIKTDQLLSAAEADAVLLLFMAVSAATLLSTLILLWRADAAMKAELAPGQASANGSPSRDLALDSMETPQTGQGVPPAAQHSKAQQRYSGSLLHQFTADVLPQLLKLLCTPKFVLVAISFAFLVAPMLAAIGGISVILPHAEILHRLPQQLILAAFLTAGVLAPFLVPLLFWDNKVGAVALVAAHFCMLALALAYAFALAFAPAPEKALSQALVAAIALAAAITAALDLERAVDIARRERPAVVAGLMWLSAACLAIVVCGVQEVLLFQSPATAAAAMQSWKWSMVLCFAVGAAAAVAGVWMSTNQVEVSRSSERHGSRGDDTAAVEGSCTIDALHSGSSRPKAVWWQNAAASSEGAPYEAAAYVLQNEP